jgi:hypothetical protein
MRADVAQNRNTLETTGRGSGPERAEGGAGGWVRWMREIKKPSTSWESASYS